MNDQANQQSDLVELTELEQSLTTGGFACWNGGSLVFYGQNSNYSSAMIGQFGSICTSAGYKFEL